MADPVDYDCNDDEIPINVCLTTVLLYLYIIIVSGFLIRIFNLSQTGSVTCPLCHTQQWWANITIQLNILIVRLKLHQNGAAVILGCII